MADIPIDASPSMPVLLFAFGISLVTGIVFGIAPAWMASQLDAWNDRSVRDFASWLTDVMLNRSQRLALRKARPDVKKGILKIPTRVYLRDGFVFCDSAETGGPASLRLDQLAGILAGMGLLAREAGIWALGPRGDLLA